MLDFFKSKIVDLDSLTPEQIDNLSKEISVELAAIAEEACGKLDKLLNKYNLTCKMNIELIDKRSKE